MYYIGGSLLFLILIMGCQQDPVPKPKAYFRISLPAPDYTSFDSTFPYSFEYPAYTRLYPDISTGAEPFWANIDYPQFKARLHLSYKSIHGNLQQYIDDSHKMAMKHIAKSSGISEKLYQNPEHKVYGTLYDIRGTAAASPLQFYATDSSSHFLRGALYFQMSPNNDSLSPVIALIEKDIRHLLETLQWK